MSETKEIAVGERERLALRCAELLREANFVDGMWLQGAEAIAVHNPANGRVIGRVPKFGASETDAAISAAWRALRGWRKRTAGDRATILRRWFELMREHASDLARILTMEQGKPLVEAKAEIGLASGFLEWFAEEGKRLYGETIPAHRPDARILVTKQPVGVVAAITPWNFPSAMITRKLGAALAAGCTVVLKPSDQTPFSALALAYLGEQAGVPAGVINVICGASGEIGAAMTADPRIRKLTFTGSTRVGKLLAAACAGTMKRVSMELGGNAPFIVFDDADLDAAVSGALLAKFRNAGQTCVCANRILVHSKVYDRFAEVLATRVRELRLGDGLEDGTEQGPLINSSAVENMKRLVRDAREQGAVVLTGGSAHNSAFFEPTVLCEVKPSMAVAREEIFGPIAPLLRFETEDEALALANDCDLGLASYMYTRDLARFWRVSEALECGMVGVNISAISTEVAPFGGVKESGLGREGSRYGLDDYVDVKYICVGGV